MTNDDDMLNPRDQASFDQLRAIVLDHFPPLWRQLYERLIKQGFNEAHAMELLKTYILSTGSNGVRP